MKKTYLILLGICLLALSVIAWAANEPIDFSGDDLSQWNHPAKTVFAQNDIDLLEVSSENQANYTFSVEFKKDLTIANEAYFDKVVKAVAKAVAFNSFEINDDSQEIVIGVTCNKGTITQVVYNDNPNYFADLKAFSAKEEQLRELLLKNIPELGNLEKMVLKNSDGKAKMVIYISAKPDPEAGDVYQKEYYTISIDQVNGEDQDGLDQFLIHKDTNQIVWKDAEANKYITVAEWRKLATQNPYWPDLFTK